MSQPSPEEFGIAWGEFGIAWGDKLHSQCETIREGFSFGRQLGRCTGQGVLW